MIEIPPPKKKRGSPPFEFHHVFSPVGLCGNEFH